MVCNYEESHGGRAEKDVPDGRADGGGYSESVPFASHFVDGGWTSRRNLSLRRRNRNLFRRRYRFQCSCKLFYSLFFSFSIFLFIFFIFYLIF